MNIKDFPRDMPVKDLPEPIKAEWLNRKPGYSHEKH